jgi:hypothetical protein
MSIGPLNDIVITITNVIRKSAYATDAFNGSDEAEAMFDEWQKQVLNLAQQLHEHWNDKNLISDWASQSLEEAFKVILPPTKKQMKEYA